MKRPFSNISVSIFWRRFSSIQQKKVTPYSFKEAWLGESAVYPLMACMGVAFSFVIGFSFNAWFINSKDVKVSPRRKNEILRDYGTGHTTTFTESLGTRPIFNAKRYKTLPYEGLGVDHKEWLKQKEAGK